MKHLKSLFLPKPKSANVLGAVNKPLSSAGKQLQSKSFRMETASNEDSSSNPGSPQRSKTRYQHLMEKKTVVVEITSLVLMSGSTVFFRHESAEMDHSENEDITIKRADGTDKVMKPHISTRLQKHESLRIPFVLQSIRGTRKYSIHTLIPLVPW